VSVIHCEDENCADFTVTTIESVSGSMNAPGVTLGPQGHPVVAYSDSTGTLKLLVCENDECSVNHITAVAPDVYTGAHIETLSDGTPIVVYIDRSDSSLKLLFLSAEFVSGE
jgi:hypothetical protein